MHVARKTPGTAGSGQAALRHPLVAHVGPSCRSIRTAVDEADCVLTHDQGQRGQKVALRLRQRGARPVDRRAGVAAQRVVRMQDGGVVVALDNHRPAGRMRADDVQHRAGIGAISDQVAEKRESSSPLPARMAQACLQGLQVAVQVRQQCDLHEAGSASVRSAQKTLPADDAGRVLQGTARAPAPIATSILGVDVDVLGLLDEDGSDDQRHAGHDDRVPQAVVHIAGLRHDGECGRRQQAPEPSVADMVGQAH